MGELFWAAACFFPPFLVFPLIRPLGKALRVNTDGHAGGYLYFAAFGLSFAIWNRFLRWDDPPQDDLHPALWLGIRFFFVGLFAWACSPKP